MSSAVVSALDDLRGLGSPADLTCPARPEHLGSRGRKVNSHVHLPPNFSAFTTVAQAIDLAQAEGIQVLGVSNYYDYEVYGDFAQGARQAGIFPLFGLEIICLIDDLVRAGVKINDPGNPGKMYICGKGITRFAPFNAEAQRLLGLIRLNDSTRMREVVRRLSEVLAERGLPLGLTESSVLDRVAARHGCPRERIYLQERHVCQAFQEAIFAAVPVHERLTVLARLFGLTEVPSFGPEDSVRIQNELRAHLLKSGKPAYVAETFVHFEQARALILELGGIPAYPVLADGANPICAFETPVERLIAGIQARGFHCAEFIPLRNQPELLASYVRALRGAGLVVTAGTEHNTLDLIPLEPHCLRGAPVPEDIREIFWEGACVVAAHQFLALHGQCGLVDANGVPNTAFADAESRITALRALGETLMARYAARC